MATTRSRPRSQSLSGSDPKQEQEQEHDAGPATTAVQKRVPLPRAASAGNMYHLAQVSVFDDDDDDVAREQFNAETLRDLARFFRTTSPPSVRQPSFDMDGDCFGSPPASDKRRWSIQSLRRGRKSRLRPVSLQPQILPDAAIAKTTAAGHSYVAISVPDGSLETRSASLRNAQLPPNARVIDAGWPQRSAKPQAQDGAADDLVSTRSSTMRMYTNALKMLGPIPADEDEVRMETTASAMKSPVVTVVTSVTTEPHPDLHEASPLARSPLKQSISMPQLSIIPDPAETTDLATPMLITPTEEEPKNSFSRTSSPATSPRPGSSSSNPGPKSFSHRRQLSAFPNTTSPRHIKKPSNIQVKSTLDIPKVAPMPESPGFPRLLAAMTFPSPPESAASHSAKNSISSTFSGQSVGPPGIPRRSILRSVTPSSMDHRLMQPARPPLRKYRSDGGVQAAYMSQTSIATSVGTYNGEMAELAVAKTARPFQSVSATASPIEAAKTSRPGSADSAATTKPPLEETATAQPVSTEAVPKETSTTDPTTAEPDEEQRKSSGSTFDSTTASESQRYSIRSDTTATSDATDQTLSRRNSYDSMTILDRKRSRWSLHRAAGSRNRDESTEDERQPADSERSQTPRSIANSVSSASTATQSLAERRMARKAKVKEKFHKDLNASLANSLRPPVDPNAEVIDSPVLGWFAQNAPGGPRSAKRQSGQGPSPLARSSTPDRGSTGHVTRRSSVQEVAQLIPDTVHETANASPKSDEPKQVIVTIPEPPVTPTLSISPVMVVANIEGRSPPPLRSVSLLHPGKAWSPPVRTSLRPDGKGGRQRPLPIKTGKGPLERATKGAGSNRNSVPNMPTPPISPDPTSASRRMSLPLHGSPLREGQPSSSTSTWNRASLNQRVPKISRESETQWLQAHQRETAQEWRLAALKERLRIERMAMESVPLEDVDEEGEPEATSGESLRPLREKLSNSSIGSSATMRTNRLDALKVLNTNAANRHTISPIPSPGSEISDAKTPLASSTSEDGALDMGTGLEKRLRRLEKNGDEWLGVVVPLLENMNRMLREMQRESIGRELTMKLMDSALAAASNASADSERRNTSSQYSPVSDITQSEEDELSSRPGRVRSVPLQLDDDKRRAMGPGELSKMLDETRPESAAATGTTVMI